MANRFVNEMADYHVIFACAVTDSACKQARQLIRKIKRQSPNTKIAIAGCYPKLWPEDIKELGVEVWSDWKKQFGEKLPINQNRGRAFLKIQDGCDHKCKYCTIRIARGKSISEPIDKVIDGAQKLNDAVF